MFAKKDIILDHKNKEIIFRNREKPTITMAKRGKTRPCSITFHLPKEDIILSFEYYEFVSAASRDVKHKYIYFERSEDVICDTYENWHKRVFDFGHRGKHEPCEATVRLYDEHRNNIIEVFRLTEVLPERSVIGPRDDKRPDERVVECADYRFVDRVEITDN